MFNLTAFAIVALIISIAASAAENELKEECPTHDLDAIEKLIRVAPSCRRAVTIFETCEFGTSGDVSLGAAVTEKCEADFTSKLSDAQRRAYNRKRKRCERKYQDRAGTMYRSFEAFCQAYLARDYSTKFLKRSPNRK
jgi:hypothetical protein